MKRFRPLRVLAASVVVAASCGVNSPIRIADGTTVEGGRTTVNGGISIGSGCEVRSPCRTVNGRITVGASTEAGGLHTVKVPVDIARDVVVAGSVGTVNGSLSLAENVTVEGDVIVRDDDRKVLVILESGGTVLGRVVNAEVVDRSGGARG